MTTLYARSLKSGERNSKKEMQGGWEQCNSSSEIEVFFQKKEIYVEMTGQEQKKLKCQICDGWVTMNIYGLKFCSG